MCGRYAFTADPADVAEAFGLPSVPTLVPRYNAAPGQVVAVVGLKPGGHARGLAMLKWGFVPRWAKSPTDGPRPINAKAEGVATNPAFRDSFRDRRCLIPATGFYEWAGPKGAKVPHHFTLAGGGVFAFAGVWDVWKGPGGDALHTCAVITVPANDAVRPCHDRMPAILLPEQFAAWLDPAAAARDALALLAPLAAERVCVSRVGPAVNKVANDGPECLSPAA